MVLQRHDSTRDRVHASHQRQPQPLTELSAFVASSAAGLTSDAIVNFDLAYVGNLNTHPNSPTVSLTLTFARRVLTSAEIFRFDTTSVARTRAQQRTSSQRTTSRAARTTLQARIRPISGAETAVKALVLSTFPEAFVVVIIKDTVTIALDDAASTSPTQRHHRISDSSRVSSRSHLLDRHVLAPSRQSLILHG